MARRTYHQFCPIAYSLDLIGERWTLLLIRELLFGPRRFTDLLSGLPGIGKNLLSRRLKDLEAAAVIRQRRLPPPAPAVVYELTGYGEQLRPILVALFDWGQQLIEPAYFARDYLGVIPLMNVIGLRFNPTAAAGLKLIGEFHTGGEIFHARIDAGRIMVSPGFAEAPDFTAAGDTKILLQMLMGHLSSEDALESGSLALSDGDIHQLESFLAAYGGKSPAPK